MISNPSIEHNPARSTAVRPPWTSSAGWWALAVGLSIGVLFLRRPDAFLNPQLFAEDGAVFLSQWYQLGFSSLLKSYAGYFLLFPRLVAAASELVPVRQLPALFAAGSVLGVALGIAVVFHARIGQSPRVKLALSVAMVAAPVADEVFMTPTNVQWVMSPALFLLAASTLPLTRRDQLLDYVYLLVLGLTGPFIIFASLLFGFSLLRQRTRHGLVMWLLSLGCAGIQLSHFGTRPSRPGLGPLYDFVQTLAARLGYLVTGRPHGWGADAVFTNWCILLAFGLLMGVLLTSAVRNKEWTTVTVALGGGLLLAAGLSTYKDAPLTLLPLGAADRYFHIPTVALCWVLILSFRRHGYLSLPLLAAIGLVFVRSAPWPARPDLKWKETSRCLETPGPCQVPISPPGWYVVRE